MTDPQKPETRSGTPLPDVDAVIHEAREASWHLPPTDPTPVHEPAAHAAPHRPDVGHAPADAPSPADEPYAAASIDTHRDPTVVSTSHAPAHVAAQVDAHAPAGHGVIDGHGVAAAGHGSGHDAGHDAPNLGPVDVEMWGAGILAAAVGLLMAACFVLATSGIGAY